MLSPRARLECVVVGALGGLFPVPAATTVVTLFLCYVLQQSALQITVASAVNLVATPVELACVPKFAVLGAMIVQRDASSFTAAMIATSMQKGLLFFVTNLTELLLFAVLGWFVLAICTVAALMSIRMNGKRKWE